MNLARGAPAVLGGKMLFTILINSHRKNNKEQVSNAVLLKLRSSSSVTAPVLLCV
jgi:hypothetical protein